ncbi:MAG: hypothetical protein JWO35_695 [Candidatus Saccharibacteria bacterium]|nr:hypothetical protein [Candidatus Saccharibacteria bacterium]
MKRQRKTGLFLAIAVLATVLFSLLNSAPTATAANPTTMSFQGKVVNADGTNVTDGTYGFVFKLYTAGSGGSALWTETQSSVTVTAGVFQVNLGSSCSFFVANACNNSTPIDFNANSSLHLGITFNSDPAGEMSPRVQLQSVPFAFNSDRVGGLTVSQLVQLSPGSQQSGFVNVSGASTFGNGLTVTTGGAGIGGTLTVVSSAAGSSAGVISSAASATAPTLIVRAGATPLSGGDLLQFQNSSSVAVGKVQSDGVLNLAGTSGTVQLQDSTTALGDKIGLYASSTFGRYGFGIQANALVAYLGASSAAFAVKVDPTTGQASSAVASVFTVSGTGDVVASGTITGTTLNGTIGINTGAGAGTQRIDASGNILNAGNFTSTAGSTFTATGANGFTFKPGTNNASTFQVQNSTGASIFTVDSLNNVVTANANLLSQRTGTGAALMVDRTDGVIGSLKSGSAKVAFFYDSAGSFSISKDTRANIAAGSGSGTDVLTALASGNVGIGTSSPASLLSVGATNQFQVDSSGNIASVGNVTTSGSSLFKTTGANGFAFMPGTDNTTVFQVQKANGVPLLLVDSTTINLLTNPGFEIGITGWSARGSSTLSQNLVTSNTYHGISSLKAITTAINSGATTSAFTQTVAAGTYTLSFYAKNSGAVNTLRAGYNQGASDVACTLGSTALITAGFQRYTCTFTSTANLTSLYIDAGATASNTLYIDAVQLQTGSSATPYQIGNIQIRGVISNPLTVQNSADSTTAFQIQNAAGTANTFVVDTVNGRASASVGFAVGATNGATLTACTASQYLGTAKLTGGIITSGVCTNDATGISDARLKTNIQQLGSALNGVKNLKTYSFDYRCTDPEFAELNLSCDRQTGVIAQELQQIFPDLVSQREDGYYQVDYRGLSVYTLNAVGELARNVDNIQSGTTPSGAIIASSLTSNGALAINSGSSGDVAIDSGGSSAYVKIGTEKAAGVSISRAGAITNVDGSLNVDESADFTGPVSMNFATAQNLRITSDLKIDNASTSMPVDAAIEITNSGGGGYTNIISTPNFTVSGAGDVSAKNVTSKDGSFQLLDAAGTNVVTIDNGGNASFKGNLNIASASLSGGLNVGGDINVAGLSTFQKLATFIGKTIFRQDVQFDGHITVAKDGAGYATLRTTETTVHVDFVDDYAQAPVVSAAITNGKFAAYTIDNVTVGGFDITMQSAALADTTFSWTAIGVNTPQTATNPLPVTP